MWCIIYSDHGFEALIIEMRTKKYSVRELNEIEKHYNLYGFLGSFKQEKIN